MPIHMISRSSSPDTILKNSPLVVEDKFSQSFPRVNSPAPTLRRLERAKSRLVFRQNRSIQGPRRLSLPSSRPWNLVTPVWPTHVHERFISAPHTAYSRQRNTTGLDWLPTSIPARSSRLDDYQAFNPAEATMASLASKRKRPSNDMPLQRPPPGMDVSDFDQHYLGGHEDPMGGNHNDGDMGFAAALAQHNADHLNEEQDAQHNHGQVQASNEVNDGGQSASDTAAAAMAQYHTLTVPQSTEQAFMAQVADASNDRANSASADQGMPGGPQRTNSFGEFEMGGGPGVSNGEGSPTDGGPQAPGSSSKPQVGTDEWHKIRKDNHKEVERRRRETINEGINELAKIVPGCEKNKGSILARAVQFITQLKENETQNIEKWTLEKLLSEQAITELGTSCDKLKAECQRAWAECEQWKKAAQKAGVTIDHDEKGEGDAE
ncbi:unnamed protein product [Zymoseptoria tritici ST99CH_1A5]|nr:unnamed protein product [Zymoseptoria tritici ST99CH_1E4]SMR47726.1 unnamed protein product [Zymoseptoria tritici ST99CH_3D1]SMY21629.1 unnamed protein product [Zymoseptoria tritici ST99CH_1A5]